MTAYIIVPAYNAASFLPDTIASIRSQTVESWRAVIVDDGSPDDSAEVAIHAIDGDARISVIRQRNAGVSAARNRGRCAALEDPTCDSLLFLDSDDRLRLDALDTLTNALRSDPAASAAHGLATFIDSTGRGTKPGELETWCYRRQVPVRFGLRNLDHSEPSSFESLVCVHGVPTTGVLLMRRRTSELAGEFDTSIPMTSDWEMCVRLARFGHLTFVDKLVLDYRLHANNLSKNVHQAERQAENAWRQIWDSTENTLEQRAAIKRGYRAWHLYMAARKPGGAWRAAVRRDIRPTFKELAYGANHVRKAVKRHPGTAAARVQA